jgi:phage-related minor tail protein
MRLADDGVEVVYSYNEQAAAARAYAKDLDALRAAMIQGRITPEQYETTKKSRAQDYIKELEALEGVNELAKEVGNTISNTLTSATSSWIDAAVEGTFRFRDSLKELLVEIPKVIAQLLLMKSIEAGINYFLPGLSGASKGAVLPQGIYNSPQVFAFAGGGVFETGRLGVMAEAGPEAIMPLARTSHGDLGVKSEAPVVNVNVRNEAAGDGYHAKVNRLNQGEIEIVVQKVADDIQRGGNRLSRSMESAYKLRRGR